VDAYVPIIEFKEKIGIEAILVPQQHTYYPKLRLMPSKPHSQD
jgi:hypothetical protein